VLSHAHAAETIRRDVGGDLDLSTFATSTSG
jgi:hypothetical protein